MKDNRLTGWTPIAAAILLSTDLAGAAPIMSDYAVTAIGAGATPIVLEYAVTDIGGGLYDYEFTVTLDNSDGNWVPGQMWDWLIFGDQQQGASPLADFVGDLSDLPIGPWTSYAFSSGFHNGPTLLAFPDPGWIPGSVGESLSWSGTSTANLGQGELLWSTLITGGGAMPVTFMVANLIPAPGTIALLGLVGLMGTRRRRK